MSWRHIRRVLATIPLFLSTPVRGGGPVSPTIQTPDLRVVEELLGIPEAKLNIGEAALKLSVLMLPETDVNRGLEEIDGLARRVAQIVGSRSDAEFRIRAINTILYQEHAFDYDRDDMLGRKPENALLWHYLKTRKGNCQTMPLLWYAVAERLGYPVKAVSAPQHFFLRYDDGQSRVNIEATSGSVPSDQQIRSRSTAPAPPSTMTAARVGLEDGTSLVPRRTQGDRTDIRHSDNPDQDWKSVGE